MTKKAQVYSLMCAWARLEVAGMQQGPGPTADTYTLHRVCITGHGIVLLQAPAKVGTRELKQEAQDSIARVSQTRTFKLRNAARHTVLRTGQIPPRVCLRYRTVRYSFTSCGFVPTEVLSLLLQDMVC